MAGHWREMLLYLARAGWWLPLPEGSRLSHEARVLQSAP